YTGPLIPAISTLSLHDALPILILFSVLGGGVAIRHSWLQHFPNPQKSCGVDLEYLLELPLSSGFPAIFRGTGECSDVLWRFMGRSEEHTSELQSQSKLVCRLLL